MTAPITTEGVPDKPLAWLTRVASRQMAARFRSDEARRRHEDLAASWSLTAPDPAAGADDSLILMFLCCHPSLTPASAIPLTLRAVGCLTTREIAAAFLVAEATMAQRISRAKAKVKSSEKPFVLPSTEEQAGRPDRRLMARWSRSRSSTARSGIGRSSPRGWLSSPTRCARERWGITRCRRPSPPSTTRRPSTRRRTGPRSRRCTACSSR